MPSWSIVVFAGAGAAPCPAAGDGPGAGAGGAGAGSATAGTAEAPQASAISATAAEIVGLDVTDSSIRNFAKHASAPNRQSSGLVEQRPQKTTPRGGGIGEVLQRLVNRRRGGEADVFVSHQQRQAHGLAGDERPFQPGGGAGLVDGVQQSYCLCAEGVQASQVENERVVGKVEALRVVDDLIDVARIDRTGDRHNRRQVAALGPHRGAVAVEGELSVSRRQV